MKRVRLELFSYMVIDNIDYNSMAYGSNFLARMLGFVLASVKLET